MNTTYGLTRKPRKGDKIRWPNWVGKFVTVLRTPELGETLCYAVEPNGGKVQRFIWWFDREQKYNELATIIDDGPRQGGAA